MQGETVISKYEDIYNLSSEENNRGQFLFTNIRVVWFSYLIENFNISIPYIQVLLIIIIIIFKIIC